MTRRIFAQLRLCTSCNLSWLLTPCAQLLKPQSSLIWTTAYPWGKIYSEVSAGAKCSSENILWDPILYTSAVQTWLSTNLLLREDQCVMTFKALNGVGLSYMVNLNGIGSGLPCLSYSCHQKGSTGPVGQRTLTIRIQKKCLLCSSACPLEQSNL